MKIKEHTRNQKRMYRIHKQEEKIQELELLIGKLQQENQKLTKQLEDKEDFINKLQATKDKLNKWDYENTKQQKEFIKYLEDTIQKEQKNLDDLCDIYKVPKENNSTYKFLCSFVHRIEEILSKYKEIIGDDK